MRTGVARAPGPIEFPQASEAVACRPEARGLTPKETPSHRRISASSAASSTNTVAPAAASSARALEPPGHRDERDAGGARGRDVDAAVADEHGLRRRAAPTLRHDLERARRDRASAALRRRPRSRRTGRRRRARRGSCARARRACSCARRGRARRRRARLRCPGRAASGRGSARRSASRQARAPARAARRAARPRGRRAARAPSPTNAADLVARARRQSPSAESAWFTDACEVVHRVDERAVEVEDREAGHRAAFLSTMVNSTRRFFARPSAVAFDATGRSSPKPAGSSRSRRDALAPTR